MDEAILQILEQHGSLAYAQVAALLREPPDAVRATLAGLRDRRLVAVLAVGDLVDHRTDAVAYWRLTDEGRAELSRLRAR